MSPRSGDRRRHRQDRHLSSLASGFLFELLKASPEAPAAVVEPIEGNPAAHVAAIRQLQIGMWRSSNGTTKWPRLARQNSSGRRFAVPPVEHRLATREMLHWHDLTSESFIVRHGAGVGRSAITIQRLAGSGRHPNIHPSLCRAGRPVIDGRLSTRSDP